MVDQGQFLMTSRMPIVLSPVDIDRDFDLNSDFIMSTRVLNRQHHDVRKTATDVDINIDLDVDVGVSVIVDADAVPCLPYYYNHSFQVA